MLNEISQVRKWLVDINNFTYIGVLLCYIFVYLRWTHQAASSNLYTKETKGMLPPAGTQLLKTQGVSPTQTR